MRGRFPLFWLALHRRRRMLAMLAAGMVVFEALMVLVIRAVPPVQMFAGSGHAAPDALKAFSGSTGDVSIASYAGLLGAGLVHPFWIAMQLTAIGSLTAWPWEPPASARPFRCCSAETWRPDPEVPVGPTQPGPLFPFP